MIRKQYLISYWSRVKLVLWLHSGSQRDRSLVALLFTVQENLNGKIMDIASALDFKIFTWTAHTSVRPEQERGHLEIS